MHIPLQRTAQSRRTPAHGARAVVLGASMSGLLAARVLSEFFDEVTVVERDHLSGEARPRRGVPQARHTHVLQPRGAKELDGLFPGLLQEFRAAGVPVADALDQVHFEVNGHVFLHDPHIVGARRAEGAFYGLSRPFLEASVLRRVRDLANVEILDGYDVEGLTADDGNARVVGARVSAREVGGPTRELPADLVVAATGRSGRAPAWLQEMGYEPPPEERVRVDLMYVSQRVRFAAGSLGRLRALLVGSTPERPVAAGGFAQEGGHWIVTLAGYAGHHPPMDREAWLSFGEEILPEHFARALRQAEPLEELQQHRFPANLRRRYDKLRRFPQGFLVTGDALASFNPIYGQGMTVAALEALALRESLRHGWDELAPRFFHAAAKPSGEAWRFALGGDLSLPEAIVPGARPLPMRAMSAYVDRFQAAAEDDAVMAWRFFDVTGFDQPAAALFSPDSLRRLAADRRHRRRAGALATAGQVAAVGKGRP
ncbi:MAG TPA: FAD-dependent monooxygenase [Nocardioidaceae bacterium]|nr:FAD-dependent monooxygenase [Nocardioidaceae bacterium]